MKFLLNVSIICAVITYPLMNYAQLDIVNKNLELLNSTLKTLNNAVGNIVIEVPQPQPIIIKPSLVQLPLSDQKPLVAENQALQLYQIRAFPQDKADLVNRIKEETKNPLLVQQFTQKIPAAEYAFCGYHALYNGLVMLNYILKPAQRPDIVKKLYSAISYINFVDEFKGDVVRERTRANRGNRDGSWLQGDELEELVVKIAGSNVLLQEGLSIANPTAYFTVIDNIEWFATGHEARGVLDSMIATIEEFRKQPNFVHVFLLGFSREYEGSSGYIEGTSSHWVAVVVNKAQGQVQYLILDSLNNPMRIETRDVKELKNILETANVVDMKIKASQFGNEMDTIKIKLEFLDKGGDAEDRRKAAIVILNAVSKIIETATQEDFFNKPEFAQYKENMISTILKINSDEGIRNSLGVEDKAKLEHLVTILLPD